MNRPPIINDQYVSVEAGDSIEILLQASDADGDYLTYTLQALPTGGTISGILPELTYTADSDSSKIDQLQIAVDDGNGGKTFAAITIEITNPKNQKLNIPMGINLAGVNFFSSEWVWVDAFKHSSDWFPQTSGKSSVWNTGEELQTTPEGWPLLKPGQAAGTLMFRNIENNYPKGRYICTYKGSGKISFGYAAEKVAQRGRRIELEVTPSNSGIYLKIEESDPLDPIREIKVFLPESENASSSFHPLFLERIGFAKTIRFMDWMRTNNNSIEKWSERPNLQSARQSLADGVALEYMIELANTLQADPWFCMPHLANNGYVRNFAELVKSQLNSNLKVYIEYSNEVWNSIFKQGTWCRTQGLSLGLSENGFEAQLRFQSQRSVEMFKIWGKVFGGTDRLVQILSSQNANPWVSKEILSWNDAYKNVDALAIAPYFGNGVAEEIASFVGEATVEDVINLTEEAVEKDVTKKLKEHRNLVDQFGLRLISYEGGQHLVGKHGLENKEPLTRLLTNANRNPRMYNLYTRLFEEWKAVGGNLFVPFNSVSRHNKWGSWGLLEYQNQSFQTIENAPKFRAVVDAALSND